MNGVCCIFGQPATAACDAPGCQNEMCDAHMYAHLTRSFRPRSAARREHAGPSGQPVQWFCVAHKALADQ
jgi:hypothetical protein